MIIVRKKNLLEIGLILLAAVVFGLGRNYFSNKPLLLFKARVKAIHTVLPVEVGEADAELVRQMIGDPGVVLLDARPPELYRLGFIPGAVNLPVAMFAEALPPLALQLRAARLLIVYCGGPKCNDAADLAAKLYEKGFKDLLIYRGGMGDWQRKGNAFAR
jgi:rhodanese-related sulfurtransferase